MRGFGRGWRRLEAVSGAVDSGQGYSTVSVLHW